MPERAELARLDEQEALRRLQGVAVPGVATPDAAVAAGAVRPVGEIQGDGRFNPGAFPRGMGPAGFMAMQRLAGNRAMVQALGRSQMSGVLQKLDLDAEEELTAGGAAPAMESPVPGAAGSAAEAPGDGAGSSGPAGGSSGSGSPGAPEAPVPPAGLAAGRAAAAGEAVGAGLAAGGAAAAGERATGAGLAAGGAAAAGERATGAGLAAGGAAAAGETVGAAGPGAGSAGGRPAERPSGAAGPASSPGGGGAGGAATKLGGSRKSPPPPITTGGAGLAPSTAAAAPAVTPVPAPAVPTPTGPGGTPDPETAKTGIDWNKMLSDFGPPVRTVLEIGRLIPGWGLVAGFASDSINFASDIASVPNSQNAAFAEGLIVFRSVVNIGNNALGHLLYVDQLIQDGLAGSVVAAEFTALTASINEVLAGVKVVLDEVLMGTDIVVEVEALYEAGHAPNTAEADKWKSLADGYAANILGDVVNTVLDVISLASAGAANTGPVQQAKQPLTLAGAFIKNAGTTVAGGVNNVINVWLGGFLTKGRTEYPGSPTDLRNQAIQLDVAGGFVDVEALQARTTYDGINLVIDAFEAYADDQIDQVNTVVEALSGGTSAFQLIRDAVRTALDDMQAKLAMVQQLGASATNAKANAESISAGCDSALATIDALVMPDVRLPSVDLGEGVLAEAASAVANTAAEAANAALSLAISGVSAALDTAKESVRSPILSAKSQAASLGEWLGILATQSTAMVESLTTQIATFNEGLGHCTNVEQVINLIIGQVSDLTGMPKVTVQELRDDWAGVGTHIDQFAALGPQLHDRAADLRTHADEVEEARKAGRTPALPPSPPPGSGSGAGTGPGASAAA
ncbi:MAG TPA: hypothetical protein VIH94_08700 [Candidatus Limnocylindrales bacterium]